jgi:hypothetical protein
MNNIIELYYKDNLIESYLNELNESSKRYYHVSTDNLNNKILYPRIPSNTYIDRGYENNTIPRISFALDIDHCLLALGKNIKGKVFNVYEPYDYNSIKVITNDELIKKQYTPDAKYTKEVWIVTKCKMKYIGKIKVINASNDFEIFKLGPGSMKDYTVKMYYWNYKIIDKGDIE